MRVRTFPSILLYSQGLALALSLLFNGFLLYEQSRQRSLGQDELGNSAHVVDHVLCQQQLADCRRTSHQQDSLIHQLEQAARAHPEPTVTAHHTSAK